MARAELPLKIKPGCVLDRRKAEVLLELARSGERGSCAVYLVMPAGLLASLVTFGLAEHAPDLDDLGDRRFRVTAAGLDVLKRLGC